MIFGVGWLALVSSHAYAATGQLSGNVKRVLMDEDRYGHCLVRLDKDIREATGLNCKGDYVTMDCQGTYLDKVQAYKMFDLAQMAMALDKRIGVVVDDSRTHSDYCLATRIDVLR